MKRILALVLAAVMMTAVLAFSASAADNLLDNTKWECKNDSGSLVPGASGITVGADGKVELTALQTQWLHLVQKVTVKAGTTYSLEIVATLSEGGLRVDHDGEGSANENGFVENQLKYETAGPDSTAVDYGKKVTFKLEIKTKADQTELTVDLRNCCSAAADPWYSKAVGTIDSITLVEAGGSSSGEDTNPGTSDVLASVAVIASVAAAGALM